MNQKEQIQNLKEILKRKGIRLTKARKKIIEILATSKKHLSPDEIYSILKKSYPSTGYATVYRTLKVLTEEKITKKRKFNEKTSLYELTEEEKHHDHLICGKCGAIIEFKDERIEVLQKKIARKFGFEIEDHKLELYGICPACKKSKS
jgi:Fur family ferric uptake transcriptional regulator